jgi:hypothetical protein
MSGRWADALAAGAAAAAISGAPSTVWAVVAGEDPLEATLAAGAMLLPREQRRARLVAAAVPVHLGISCAWAFVLERVLPRGHEVPAGILAGLAIAALDLALAARFFPRMRTLRTAPQLADHAVYGTIVGYVLARRRRSAR